MEEKLSTLKCIKVIFVTLVALSIPIGSTTYLLHRFLGLNYIFSGLIGIALTVIIIFAFGLYKPAYENENKEYVEDFDD